MAKLQGKIWGNNRDKVRGVSPRLLANNVSVEHSKYVEKKKPEVDPREAGWQRISVVHKPLDQPKTDPTNNKKVRVILQYE